MNNEIDINRKKMRKIKIVRDIIFITDIILAIISILFFVAGGFTIFFALGILFLGASFVIGANHFEKKYYIYIMTGLNIAAFLLYLIIRPVSDLVYGLEMFIHFICIAQLIGLMVCGSDEMDLMNEPGYPYFTEQSIEITAFKSYVPVHMFNYENSQSENNINKRDISDNIPSETNEKEFSIGNGDKTENNHAVGMMDSLDVSGLDLSQDEPSIAAPANLR